MNGLHPGQRVQLDPQLGVTLGRNQSNLWVLPMDELVSGNHCRVIFEDGQWVLEDLGSTNGTLLNEKPVRRSPLSHKDIVTVGGSQFRFTTGEGPESKPLPIPATPFASTQVVDIDAVSPPPAPSAKPPPAVPPAGRAPVPSPPVPSPPVASPPVPPPSPPSPGLIAEPPADSNTAGMEGDRPPPSFSDYDSIWQFKAEDLEEEKVVKAEGSGRTWLDTQSPANMLWAMSSIAILFLVMLLFFTRLV